MQIDRNIPINKTVTYNFAKRVGSYSSYVTWYNVTYGTYTGYLKADDVREKTLDTPGNIYPYHFDYMNVHIKDEQQKEFKYLEVKNIEELEV